uniref:Uncharacterized protein n=1 Tax=Panagrolaimus superbus TaxID=310955 RepID=A0A914XUE3_9BILA
MFNHNRSTLQASIPLRNAFHKTLFNINFISSRHLLKNLGRQIETESIGIQATPRLRNNRSQTSTVSKLNVGIQTSKKIQKNLWTLNASASAAVSEMKNVSTQTDFAATKSFSIFEERKALMKLIVLLVCKLSTKINGSRIRNGQIQTAKSEAVEEIPPEPVDLHAAQQFSNLRKKQIEQMRERLHQMAEERKEILELTNAKMIDPQKKPATVTPKSVVQQRITKKPDIAAFLEPISTSKIIQKSNPLSSTVTPYLTNYSSAPNPSFEFSTDKERIILSPDLLSAPTPQPHQPQPSSSTSEQQHPQTPTPAPTTSLEPNKSLPFSRQESVLSSIHSQAASEGELEELPSPIQSSEQSPIPPPSLRRKSYTLAETSQESVKSVSNFLEPSIFVPQQQQQRPKHVEIREPERSNTPIPPPKNVEIKSESTSVRTLEESTESSSASESSESTKKSSSSATSSSTTESSSSTSSDSTLKKPKPSSPTSSSSSSTLGEGSISTEESIQEEIPEALDSDADSAKDVSSISEASSISK